VKPASRTKKLILSHNLFHVEAYYHKRHIFDELLSQIHDYHDTNPR